MVSSHESGERYKNTEASGGTMTKEKMGEWLVQLVDRHHELEESCAMGDDQALHDLNRVNQNIRYVKFQLKNAA